jgi:hypothetical protein
MTSYESVQSTLAEDDQENGRPERGLAGFLNHTGRVITCSAVQLACASVGGREEPMTRSADWTITCSPISAPTAERCLLLPMPRITDARNRRAITNRKVYTQSRPKASPNQSRRSLSVLRRTAQPMWLTPVQAGSCADHRPRLVGSRWFGVLGGRVSCEFRNSEMLKSRALNH